MVTATHAGSDNLFGTVERVAWGMQKSPEELREFGEQLAFLRQPEPPGGWREAMEMLPLLKTVMAMKPKSVSNPPCQEIVLTGDEIDLGKLPVQTCWPGEPAPLITWPLVVTQGHDSKSNIGIYRMQVTGRNTTLMRWLAHRGGAKHANDAAREGSTSVPAAAIGADPATIIAAVAPVPETSRIPVRWASARSQAGPYRLQDGTSSGARRGGDSHRRHVSLTETGPEGLMAIIRGTTTPLSSFRCLLSPPSPRGRPNLFDDLHRAPAGRTVGARPIAERCVYSVAGAAVSGSCRFLAAAGGVFIPGSRGIDCKTYSGQAKRIMMGVWSYLKQFMYTKFVIVVDEDIDARKWEDVIWAISTNVDAARDMTVIENTPIDYLDFASPVEGLGSKMELTRRRKSVRKRIANGAETPHERRYYR